ncbi:hypothetical protein H3S84_00165 [Bartonella sp. W8098]|uniref:hypothetical protein n=1 Tax=Bartonella TaxID=773 RepID=UPI0018DC4D7A|nr:MULTISPECIES: hypothetical protein [Bartonella]MBH9986684.1 hypothetical protein [Bartonella apis]MBI0171266.1 hypothetical protein [Bartonella sp. W8151]
MDIPIGAYSADRMQQSFNLKTGLGGEFVAFIFIQETNNKNSALCSIQSLVANAVSANLQSIRFSGRNSKPRIE